jgi:hypothetical protein
MARRTRAVRRTSGSEVDVTAEQFASNLSNAFLQCRELGHQWRPWSVVWDRKARCFDRQLRCSACKTIRKQLLDSHGHVIRNGYDYTDGYLSKHLQPGTYSRDVFRLEALTRFLDKQSTPTPETA